MLLERKEREEGTYVHAAPSTLLSKNPVICALGQSESSSVAVTIDCGDGVHWERDDALHEGVVVILQQRRGSVPSLSEDRWTYFEESRAVDDEGKVESVPSAHEGFKNCTWTREQGGSHEKNLFLTLSPVMTRDASVSPAAWSLRNCNSISSRAGRSYEVERWGNGNGLAAARLPLFVRGGLLTAVLMKSCHSHTVSEERSERAGRDVRE